MKSKLTKIIAFVLCAICVFYCGACKKDCAHNDTVLTNYYKEVDGKVYKTAKCNDCNKTVTVGEEISVYAVADHANDLVNAQIKSDFSLNPIVLIKSGNYPALQVTAYDGITIICEENVFTEKVIVHEDVCDVVIDGVNFNATQNSGGVTFNGNSDNVTIKNCCFTGNTKISSMNGGLNYNTVVENCVMKDLFYGNSNFTAIIIYRYMDLTVKKCVFDGVGYNVLQVGNHERGGVVTVTGNTFKNVGSRVLYFVNLSGITTCTVSGNYFYDNTDCTQSAVYINAGGGTRVDVGVNYWEVIPEKDAKYIASNTNYDPAEQLVIS